MILIFKLKQTFSETNQFDNFSTIGEIQNDHNHIIITIKFVNFHIFFLSQSQSLARSKFTAIGAYILICLIFVVATLFQLTALLVLKQKFEEKVEPSSNKKTKSINIEYQNLIRKIDKICTFVFPLTFGVLNGIYWAYMLQL